MKPRHPRSRIRRHLALLIGVPLLLLMPLGVAKWRAEHPPPSAIDWVWQTTFGHASEVRFDASGNQWQSQLDKRGLSDPRVFIVRNPQALQDLAAIMHSSKMTPQEKRDAFNSDDTLSVAISVYGGPGTPSWHFFRYWQTAKRGYLSAYDPEASDLGGELAGDTFTVPPLFAARIEKLLIQLVQRIQAAHSPTMTLE